MRTFNMNDRNKNEAVSEYFENGGFVLRGLVSENVLEEVNKYLDTQGSSYKQLIFDSPWGYGNMGEHVVADHIHHTWLVDFSSHN